jgi:putative hydrolase of HD superfamily
MKDESSILNWTDEQILEAARQLRVAYQLKRTLRYASTRDHENHSESVAEHVFGLFYLAQYFLPLEDPEKKLDVEKLYRILLFHDFGEITHGDFPYHIKTKEHEKQEREDAKIVFASLPALIQQPAIEAWQDFDQQQSPEAKFASALDKIEPAFELMDPISEKSLKRTKFTYGQHMKKKLTVTEGFPIMRKFVEVLGEDMRKRKVFWEEDN